jgi:vitamin K-dependent gamma-carboxylase
MFVHMLALGALAVLVTIGLWYRLSSALLFLGFTYIFLLEQARYLNHFYLVVLITFLMIFVPAHRAFSVDALRRPANRANTAPAWALWLIRFQIGIVYFLGDVAKLNADWLRGEPMRTWLAKRTEHAVLGPFFEEQWMVYLFSYGGLLLDLLIVPLLLWRRTRIFAFVLVVGFHLTNAWLFTIGIFPWMAIAATTVFLRPDWPRRIFCGLFAVSQEEKEHKTQKSRRKDPEPDDDAPLRPRRIAGMAPAGLYLALQILVPMRHFLYPGNVSWTEEGHRFAWHMKLRIKSADCLFLVTDPQNHMTWQIDPRDDMPRWQARKMSARPDMILQYSHHLARLQRQEGHERVEVRARVTASLNGRKAQLLIDPEVELGTTPRTLRAASWIMPLVEPLSPAYRDKAEDP